MFRNIAFLFLLSYSMAAVSAQDTALPVKRVVLYKNGIGYFEHLGRVRGNQDVNISFTSGQLNDVLKSVTVLDLNGGHISGIAYGSSAPVDKQLGDLRLPLGDKTTLTEFLSALRGAKLEIRSATNVITGRLLSVERKTRMGSGATLEVDYVSLLTDSGEVKTTEVSPSFSVHLLERGLTGKVDKFLDLLASSREPDVRRMTLSAEGTGERSLFVSYISEVPVWKATYRLVLNPQANKPPLLQGWAIIDNTVGQDWENVELSLVAGAPQSFIQNLSQPYYARRPVIALPESMNAAPQTFQATLIPGQAQLTGKVSDAGEGVVPGTHVTVYDAEGNLAAETMTNSDGDYNVSVPGGTYRLELESPGFKKAILSGVSARAGDSVPRNVRLNVGGVSDAVEVSAAAPGIQTESASAFSRGGSGRSLGSGAALGVRKPGGIGYGTAPLPPSVTIEAARGQTQAAASAQELGDLFEYKLKDLVTIPKNRSALVPIIQSAIQAEKVSVWNEQSGLPRPRRALWLTNSTGLTLDGGTFSVLEEETFAGEGTFDPIRPGERRLVSYATDLALNVSASSDGQAERVTHITINHGVMVRQSGIRERKTYTLRNEDTTPRDVIIEHPLRAGYQLRGEVHPFETTAGWMRFRLAVPSKQTASLVVEESRPVSSTIALTAINSNQVDLFLQQKSIDKSVEDALRKILVQKAQADDFDARISANEDESTKIFDDQQRLRENMKALKGSPEEKTLLQRYTRQLNDQEDRLDILKKQGAQLEGERDRAQALLNRMIQDLSLDVAL